MSDIGTVSDPADGADSARRDGDETGSSTDNHATRVVLSVPADLRGHARRRIEQDYYRTFLRRAHDAVAVGDTWDEFTDIGCCGSQQDVPFRVERVEGGDRIGPETVIEYVDRDAAGLACDWSVQHDEPGAGSAAE